MKKQPGYFIYILGIYVILQFTWWGYHLIQLTKELSTSDEIINKRVGMIIGEGMVFLLILILGFWKIKKVLQKEYELAERQHNFLLSVTHELKTPLAATKLYLQTLLKRNFEIEKREELLGKAILENERLEEIVEALLISARIENKQLNVFKENINLKSVLEQLAAKYNDKVGKNWIQFESNSDLLIENDLFMLKTIFINLIDNALKYAGTNYPLTIQCIKKEKEICLIFTDQGEGIPLAKQDVIFEKFIRLEKEDTRSKKGTGLGLYIVKEFTTLCGGQIHFSPNNPKGCNFEVILPL